MKTIYTKGIKPHGEESGMGEVCEVSRTNYSDRFVIALSEIITEMLDVKWKEKDLIERLIKTGIKDSICGRNGLLEQYYHSQLDITAETLKRRLGINESVGVNYENATHAKLSTIIDEIKKQNKQ